MKHKGFTLIELLAVIVILAIIVLIAVPTITGIVEKSKMGAVEQSANGYNDAINKQMALNQMDSNDENDINKGIIDAPFDEKYNLKVKGQTPTKGWVEVLKDGVYRYSLVIGEYVITYDGENTTVIKGTEPAEKPDFASQSWKTIITNVRSGNTSDYHIGDTKEVDMGEFGKHTVRIANMSTPSECSTEGFSETACGFVLEFVDGVIDTNNIYAENKSFPRDDWSNSVMRTICNNDIYNSLPSDLKEGIITTKVISSSSKDTSSSDNTSDKLYFLSVKEVFGKTSAHNTANENTRQLDYYNNIGVTETNFLKTRKDYKNRDAQYTWYLRTYDTWYQMLYYVSNGSRWAFGSGSWSNQDILSPAFRIG